MPFPSLNNFTTDRRCWLLLAVALLAIVLSFHSIPDRLALTLVSKAGFWFVLIAFAVWLHALWQTFGSDLKGLTWRSLDWAGALAIAVGGTVLLSHEEFGFKIIMDELMLLGTSMSMHLDKTAFTPTRGHDINGAFILFDGILDKRPLFFPFLLSLLHDVFGYRPANAFVLNAALTFVLLTLVFFTGRMLAGRAAGLLGVALFAGLPLLAQNCTGGGFELLNITMIFASILLGARWMRTRDSPALVAFCYSGILLVQVRYESAVFLVPIALIILFVWWQERRAIPPWPIMLAPLMLIHVPLHQRVFQIREASWEMGSQPGYSEPFSISYVPDNLQHALSFLFAPSAEQPNSVVLSALGFIAIPFFGLLLLKQSRSLAPLKPISISVALFSIGLALHFILLMCYFWGKFDDPVIRRLSLPAHATLVIAVLSILPQFPRPIVVRSLFVVAILGLLGRSVPSMAAHAYSQVYLPGREVAWRREFIQAQPRPDYFVIDQDPIFWVTHGVSSTPTAVAIGRREDLAFHMRNRTFSNVFVFQRLEVDPESGEKTFRVGDDLGPDFVLETVVEERLRVLTISRISRLKEVRSGHASTSAPAPIASKSNKTGAELEAARQVYYEKYMKRLP